MATNPLKITFIYTNITHSVKKKKKKKKKDLNLISVSTERTAKPLKTPPHAQDWSPKSQP
jgi:hypothetical protein